ncbi:MAG: GNAT family N-acetyltransferase [Promethearchaeota archaeon]
MYLTSMTANLNKLFRLTEDQVEEAGEILARAFYNNPGFIYLIPDDSERKMKLKYVFEYIIRYAVLYGEVYAPSSKLEGIAGWLSSENAYKTRERQIRSGGREVVSKIGMDFYKKSKPYEEFTDLVHKRNAPFKHWYLAPLGVDPIFQGKSYAGVLLKAMFERAKQELLPIYLETNTEKNVSIYEHYGFQILEDTIVPDTDIHLYAMLRENST